MSDNWESYSCRLDEQLAWVSFDRGLAAEIEHVVPKTCLQLRVTLRDPSPKGMPGKAEFDNLNLLEDTLVPFIEDRGGLYAGRITTQGARCFVCYAEINTADLQAFCEQQSSELGYDVAVSRRNDPERRAYWDDLYPKPDDDSVIQDLKVFEALRANGDAGNQPRRIDHWACFPSRDAAETFQDWTIAHGYTSGSIERAAETTNPFHVRFQRIETPCTGDFTNANILLRRMAKELKGVYDGWETIVVKDGR
jgi:Family of unknown function (DUF695)/Regulator of ribonuclease activity B